VPLLTRDNPAQQKTIVLAWKASLRPYPRG
jgi:hypothetical protein